MTVYLAPDHAEPRVIAWVAVRAGGRYDPADAPGLAHYLEHMLLFKGTDDLGTIDHEAERPHLARIRELYRALPVARDDHERETLFDQIDTQTQSVGKLAVPNEITRLYTQLGFSGMNAFTNPESTHYIAEVPTNRLDIWAEVEAERFADPVFRLFYPELEAVYEEKNRGLDDASRQSYVAMVEGLYPKHPYRQRVLGTSESLKTPAFDEMVSFYERWYTPNNMAIILAGDVDESVLPTLESAFSRLQPKPLAEPPPGELVPIAGRVVQEHLAEDRALVRICWPTVPAGDPDAVVLDVIMAVLDSARVGMLHTDLIQPHKVQWAGASHTTRREAGYLFVEAFPREGQPLEDVESLLLSTVERVQRGDFEPAQLSAIKRWVKIGRQAQLEFPVNTARRLLDAYIERRDWRDVVADDKRYDSVTMEDVTRVASKYFSDDRVVVLRRRGDSGLPKVSKPKITKLAFEDARRSRLARTLEARPAANIEPRWLDSGRDYEIDEIVSGRLIAVRNRRSDLFGVTYAYRHGYLDVPTICASLGALQRSGAGTDSAEALQRTLYRMGVIATVQCSEDELSIALAGEDGSLESAVELLESWLSDPNTTTEIVAGQIDSAVEIRATNREREGTVNTALGEYAKFGRRSSFLVAPADETLRAMTPQTVRRDVAALLRLEHNTIYYGPRTATQAASAVALGNNDHKARPRRRRTYQRLEGTTIFFVDRALAKATVSVTLPTAPRPRDDQPLADVASRYLGGGIGSLVFREIRTARGLAYSTDGGVTLGHAGDDAAVWGWMQNQPDKVAEAVPALLEALRRPQLEPGSFQVALAGTDRQYRSRRIRPPQVGPAVKTWLEDGLDGDPRARFFESLQRLDRAALAAFLNAMHDGPAIITIVGDASRIEASALDEIGTVQQVDADDLFSY